MNKTEILKFLNSEKTFNKVLDIINQESLKRGSEIGDYPMHYFLAGGSVANTIYYLLNRDKFDIPVINDIDLFFFEHVNQRYFGYQNNPNNFIQHEINNSTLQVDSYGRVWVGPNGEQMRMVNSERFDSINKVTINVHKDTDNFNESEYYLDLLKVFDLNCCMAGLDRINKKIIYTKEFVYFLSTNKIEVTNTAQPLQTTIRLDKKSKELKTDTSNLDIEMGLIQHSFISSFSKSIGPEWLEKTKLNRDLVLKYFDFNVTQNNRENNIFHYVTRNFELNKYYTFFYKHFKTPNSITFWDIFVRRKNDKVFNSLVNFYQKIYNEGIFDNRSLTYEDIRTRKFLLQINTTVDFIQILNIAPNYFDCDYNEEDLFIINEKNKNFVSEYYIDYTTLLVNNIKDHVRFFGFIENKFFDKNGLFKQVVFNRTMLRIYANQKKGFRKTNNYFNYVEKTKEFESALNNLWIKDYFGTKKLNHKFITNKNRLYQYVRTIDLTDGDLFEW